MTKIVAAWRAWAGSERGTVIEFAFVLPLLLMLLIGTIDAGNLFAHHRKAQQMAESLVRAARAFDAQVETVSTLPLTSAQITLLRHIAGRMQTQAPERVNYIWIGRFVRPQGSAAGSAPVQLLPAGLQGKDNQGIVLAGDAGYATQANSDAAAAIMSTIGGGEIVYVVDVTFSYDLMSPLPAGLKKRVYAVRYTL